MENCKKEKCFPLHSAAGSVFVSSTQIGERRMKDVHHRRMGVFRTQRRDSFWNDKPSFYFLYWHLSLSGTFQDRRVSGLWHTVTLLTAAPATLWNVPQTPPAEWWWKGARPGKVQKCWARSIMKDKCAQRKCSLVVTFLSTQSRCAWFLKRAQCLKFSLSRMFEIMQAGMTNKGKTIPHMQKNRQRLSNTWVMKQHSWVSF